MNDSTWIVGINPVESALANDRQDVSEMLIEKGNHNQRVNALVNQARNGHIAVKVMPRAELDKIAGKGVRHQGVAIKYARTQLGSEKDLQKLLQEPAPDCLFLILDGVTDPHNLGACLRSAAAAGVDAVIIPKHRAVGLTPVVHRASAGGSQKVALIEVTNLRRALDDMKAAGIWLVGLAGDADSSLYDCDLKGRCAVVMGSEGQGLRRLTRESCDYLTFIPMPGDMESLNVSVATGISLFEALRQRQAGKGNH